MEKVNIGGVPEHFNLPWKLAKEEGLFEQWGVDLRWTDYPSGTGAMCQDLREGKLDLAVLLTEGIVADIAHGNPSKILQWYVTTPLVWGIHVSGKSLLNTLEDIRDKKYAISRRGSGSHLMPSVHAAALGFTLQEEQFVVVDNLKGAEQALNNDSADIFYWEKFMTMPLVDNGTFRRIGEFPTPWPCFAIAATDHYIQHHPQTIRKVLDVVNLLFQQIMNRSGVNDLIASQYGLAKFKVDEWLSMTKWSEDSSLDTNDLFTVSEALSSLGIITDKSSLSLEKLYQHI